MASVEECEAHHEDFLQRLLQAIPPETMERARRMSIRPHATVEEDVVDAVVILAEKAWYYDDLIR